MNDEKQIVINLHGNKQKCFQYVKTISSAVAIRQVIVGRVCKCPNRNDLAVCNQLVLLNRRLEKREQIEQNE